MANVQAARSWGEDHEELQGKYNYLLDVLATRVTVGILESKNKNTFIDFNTGAFQLKKDDDNYFSYDGNNLTFMGGILTATSLVSPTISGTDGRFTGTIRIGEAGDNVAGLTASGSVSSSIRIWAGHATPSSAPFRVTQGGALTATNASLSGTMVSTSGILTTEISGGKLLFKESGADAGSIQGAAGPSSGVHGVDLRSFSDMLIVVDDGSSSTRDTLGIYAGKLFCAATFASGQYMEVEFEYGDFTFNSSGLTIQNDIKTFGRYFLGNNVRIFTGTGTPPSLSGAVGSLYLRSDGGATTTLYVKTGTGTTAWTAK